MAVPQAPGAGVRSSAKRRVLPSTFMLETKYAYGFDAVSNKAWRKRKDDEKDTPVFAIKYASRDVLQLFFDSCKLFGIA